MAAACTDPRARPAPPSVKILLAASLHIASPGPLPFSVWAADNVGLDSIVVSLRSSSGTFGGDSTYLIPDTTETVVNGVWQVPSGLPFGTHITLLARAYNLVGFGARDSVFLSYP